MREIPYKDLRDSWLKHDIADLRKTIDYFEKLYIEKWNTDYSENIKSILSNIRQELDKLDRKDYKRTKERKVVVKWGEGRTPGEEG